MNELQEGPLLLTLARAALVEAVLGEPFEMPDVPFLKRPGACFVTLTQAGRLRGCIGSVEPRRSLGEDVVMNAKAAALNDPRFPPLLGVELKSTRIEVSVLSPLEPMGAFDTEDEACARLRPGVDGVLLEWEDRRAVFIPQMWEKLPAPRDFLSMLREKAGLVPGMWAKGTRLFRFGCRAFEEEGGRPKEASA